MNISCSDQVMVTASMSDLGELKIERAVKPMLKGVENREFLVVPGVMANLIRLQLRFFPVKWVNWIGNKTVALSMKK